MAIAEIQRKWFVLQENSIANSPVKLGPFFDETSAITAAQAEAVRSPGVAFSVVRVVTAYQTDDPKPVQLKFAVQAGTAP